MDLSARAAPSFAVHEGLPRNRPQISKVTNEQAEQAEEYERNTRRLTAAKQDLYRVISNVVLPVANDFVKVLIDAASNIERRERRREKARRRWVDEEFFPGRRQTGRRVPRRYEHPWSRSSWRWSTHSRMRLIASSR